MSLNSVNTNVAAQVALQSLNVTNSQLQQTQKRISTGYRVSDATDDGAAFAVAQRVRADTGALTTVNQQLGSAQGLVGVALTGLTSISNNLTNAKQLLVEIGDNSISDSTRAQYIASYKTLIQQVANTVDGSTYNGNTLLGTSGVTAGASAKNVVSNENGGTSTLNSEDNSQLAFQLAALIGATISGSPGNLTVGSVAASTAQSAALVALSGNVPSVATSIVSTLGAYVQNGTTVQAANATVTVSSNVTFATIQNGIANQLNQAGADSNFLAATISFNSAKIDSLNAGLGALVDADLSKESANLQALQIRQQLGTQALSLANQSPQSILSLFK